MKRFVFLTCLASLCAWADTNLPPSGVSLDRQIADMAQRLSSDLDFNEVFSQVCRAALAYCDDHPKTQPDDCARSVFGGLWIWTREGGRPTLQGRNDWALHFIGGGAFEGYFDVGKRAAVRKEEHDARAGGNHYDLDDLAATLLGARWIEIATTGTPEQSRAWLHSWATGEKNLSRTLPKLQFGQLPASEQASSATVQRVRAFVEDSLKLPAEPPPVPAAPP
jgi:hypothetical protein